MLHAYVVPANSIPTIESAMEGLTELYGEPATYPGFHNRISDNMADGTLAKSLEYSTFEFLERWLINQGDDGMLTCVELKFAKYGDMPENSAMLTISYYLQKNLNEGSSYPITL